MKKYLTALFVCVAICTTAFAETRSPEYKKNFYDNLQKGMITSINESLIQQGMPADKVQKYSSALNGRIDRQKMENSTWACVSKYSDSELMAGKEKIAEECFSGWVTELIQQNSDLLNLLQ